MTLKMDSRVVAPLVSPQVSSTNGFRGPGAGLLSPSRKSGYHIRLHRICRTATPESILSEPGNALHSAVGRMRTGNVIRASRGGALTSLVALPTRPCEIPFSDPYHKDRSRAPKMDDGESQRPLV